MSDTTTTTFDLDFDPPLDPYEDEVPPINPEDEDFDLDRYYDWWVSH